MIYAYSFYFLFKNHFDQNFVSFCWDKLDYSGSIVYLSCWDLKFLSFYTGFECRCGGLFCGLHRYSDKHNCTYDYKADGREQIAKANPVVVGEKVKKIWWQLSAWQMSICIFVKIYETNCKFIVYTQ